MIAPLLFGGEHAPRRLLRPEEHRVEIGARHMAPFLRGHLDGAAAWATPALLTSTVTVPNACSACVERARHRRAVEHVGLDRHRPAAGLLDLGLDRREPVGAARHQCHRGAVRGQHLGEAGAEPARGAGHQRDPPGEIEQLRGFHAVGSVARVDAGT